MRALRAPSDPWVAGGLILLSFLTVGTVLLYRSAPQSVAEARSRGWVAVRPSAFQPRIARAGERARAAVAAAAAGDTLGAVREYAAAAAEAWTARGLASAEAERATATELWAGLTLDRAGLMLRSASAPWWRGDNDPMLREALASAKRVTAVPTTAATRQRAATLAGEIQRKLQPGPLEWIPRR
jgi:hypothetical protein